MPQILPFLIPVGLELIRGNREAQARGDIERAEEERIPGETASISQELIERGLGGTSASQSFRNEPRRQFDVSRRVARARDVLQTPQANPLAAALSMISQRQGDSSGTPSPFGQPQPDWYAPPQFPRRPLPWQDPDQRLY